MLYLLHGADSGPADVMDRSDVAKLAGSARVIVVMPDGGYSHYTNAQHERHSRWEDAIAFERPRDVEARFPVMKGREHTGIAGISMGGYGAVKLAAKHPELYASQQACAEHSISRDARRASGAGDRRGESG